jgi:hypothetical protein
VEAGARFIRSICSLLFLCGAAAAQPPNFDYPYLLTDSLGYIVEDNEYTIPCFGDWDDDGDEDMLLGVLYSGNVYFYENISAGILPEFAPGVIVMADGEPVTVVYA